MLPCLPLRRSTSSKHDIKQTIDTPVKLELDAMLKRISKWFNTDIKERLTSSAGFLSETRRLQQEADALRLLLVTEFRRKKLKNHHVSNNSDSTSKQQALSLDELLDHMQVGSISMREWLMDLRHAEVLIYTQQNLHRQVVNLFRSVSKVHHNIYNNNKDNNNQVHSKTTETETNPNSHPTSNPTLNQTSYAGDAQSFSKTEETNEMQDQLKQSCGFCLTVKHSSVSSIQSKTRSNIIDGVYINGTAMAGAVVGFFPGVTYLRDRVHAGDFNSRMIERGGKSDYVYMRPDRSLIDGSQRVGKLNPFALGHLIRHPSQKLEGELAKLIAHPNVMTFTFDFPLKDGQEEIGLTHNGEIIHQGDVDDSASNMFDFFPKELRPYIPNAYATTPGMLAPQSSKENFAQGAVIVALRDLKDGEELFCDYRLNPKIVLPEWYCSVNEETNEKFWGVDTSSSDTDKKV